MKSNKELIASVEVKDIPEMHVAYIRHIGPYAGDEQLFGNLFNRLCNWAGPRGLLRFPETKFITIYHDNPEITDDNKLRTDVCITVPADTQADGEIGKAVIPKGKNAVAHFKITPYMVPDYHRGSTTQRSFRSSNALRIFSGVSGNSRKSMPMAS